MADSKKPRRIAELMQGKPYRILCQNYPADFGSFVIDSKKVNVDLAEAMLTEQAPIIYADDIWDLIDTDGNIGNANVDIKKMMKVPSARPAFNKLFVECNPPHVDWSKYGGTASCAAFVLLNPFDEDVLDKIKEEMIEGEFEGIDAVDEYILMGMAAHEEKLNLTDEIIEEIKNGDIVVIYQYLFVDGPAPRVAPYLKGGKCFGPLGMGYYLLSKKSHNILRLPSGRPFFFLSELSDQEKLIPGFPSDMAPLSRGWIINTSLLAIKTIGLLNCSNVRLIHTGHTHDNVGKGKRSRERLPWIKHHELRVVVGQQELRVNGHKDGEKRINPLHMVRGHFRDYSEGKGLFGKYQLSAVWVPPHARGRAKDGIVNKDYRLVKSKQ